MNLEKLIVGVALITGCTQYEVVRKAYRKGEVKKVVLTEVVTKKKDGYSLFRLDQGEFGIYNVTFYKPPSQINEKLQLEHPKEVLNEQSFPIKETNKQIDYQKLSKKLLPISTPKYNLTEVIQSCLQEVQTNRDITADNCRAVCEVSNQDSSYNHKFSQGVFLSPDYILVPAAVVYTALINKELNKNAELTFNKAIEMETAGSAKVHKARILAISPLKNLALLETESRQELSSLITHIIQEKEIEEAKLYVKGSSDEIISDFNLNINNMSWRFSQKELELIKSLGYGIITVNTKSNFKGQSVYNSNGLIGIVTLNSNFKDLKNNSSVIPGSVIREFLTDYLDFINSKSDNLETILIDLPTIVQTTSENTSSIPFTSIEEYPEEPTVEIKKTTQENPVIPPKPIDKTLFFGLSALSLGLITLLAYRKIEVQSSPVPKDIPERLNELEKWLEPYRTKANELAEERRISEDRIVPKTKLDINFNETVTDLSDQETFIQPKKEQIDIINKFKKEFMTKEMFVSWIVDNLKGKRARNVSKIFDLEEMYIPMKKRDIKNKRKKN